MESDEEVVSYIRNASSSSDNEDTYYNGQLEEILKRLALEEEDGLINTVGSLNNIQWNKFSSKQKSFTFIGKCGLY
jgi:hypothetical protein